MTEPLRKRTAHDATWWVPLGACRPKPDQPIPAMFPDPRDDRGMAAAKDVCWGCPVQAECLAYALDRNEAWGVWGGMDPEERVLAKRRLNRQARTDRQK